MYTTLSHQQKMLLILSLHTMRERLKASFHVKKPSVRKKRTVKKKMTFIDKAREDLFNNMSEDCKKLFM